MEPSTVTKQPWEERQLCFDAAPALAAGDSVASISGVTIWEATTDRTSTMLESTSLSGNKVYTKLKGGTHGTEYWLRVRIVTTNGEKLEDDTKVVIRQLGQ